MNLKTNLGTCIINILFFDGVLDYQYHLSYVTGTDRFAKDIEMMTGRSVSGILRLVWSVVIPSFVIVSII